MKATGSAKWIVAYGIFLLVAGLAGYLSNPEKAKTALISGGTAGALSLLWGWLALKGVNWSWRAALVTTIILTAAFGWRAFAGWQAVAAGNQDKLFAAVLISIMLVVSLALLPLLFRRSCACS